MESSPLTPADLKLLDSAAATLRSGGEVRLLVRGRSMLPALRPETDEVVLRRAGVYRRADIVLARVSPSRYVLHRIIAVDGRGRVTLMGDGNLRQREECAVADIAGRVVAVSRGGLMYVPSALRGRVWMWLRPLRPLLVRLMPSFR